MKGIKFKAWDKDNKMFVPYNNVFLAMTFDGEISEISWVDESNEIELGWKGTHYSEGKYILYRLSGLKDFKGREGSFNCDIWEVKDFEYHEKWGNGYKVHKCDLRFILIDGLLGVEYKLIKPPKGLKTISLNTIFNLKCKSGKRLFIDDSRKKLEIIGTIHDEEYS